MSGHGYCCPNNRGSWLVQWARMEKLVIANTFYNQAMHDRWTHNGAKGQRPIVSVLIDQKAGNWVRDARAVDSIGTGKDHRGVKLDLKVTTAQRQRKHRGGRKKG